jgi:preprotein translocase subunit SecY
MQYSRYLTVPLAFIQAFGFLSCFCSKTASCPAHASRLVTNVCVIAAGSILLMWIGELISEFGVGNGVSLLIFAGIVSRIPRDLSQLVFSFDVSQIPAYSALPPRRSSSWRASSLSPKRSGRSRHLCAARARHAVMGGVSTYLPLRVNQAGVIPIIFALSILLFPQMIATFLSRSSIAGSRTRRRRRRALANQWVYGILYFLLVVVFTYFYTAITFEPHQIAKNLQKNGAFIPGVRPGTQRPLNISPTSSRASRSSARSSSARSPSCRSSSRHHRHHRDHDRRHRASHRRLGRA